MNLLLGNVDYQGHTSNEGDEFQRGLEHAGWMLAGAGYGNGCRSVPELLRRYEPRLIVCHDRRDWDAASPGCFRKDITFDGLEILASRTDLFRACVLKDAGSVLHFQHRFFLDTGADAAIVYYHPEIVRCLNPWLEKLRVIRTHHSVDADFIRTLDLRGPRKRAVVTGATSGAYPLRTRVMRAALADRSLDIDVFGHPGYHNRGHHTPEYLRMLAGYRVHVATASKFGFALRKIIESVAVGATPVTNLPPEDVLPEIDGALVRVPPQANHVAVFEAVRQADAAWNLDERLAWAEKALRFYDWRAIGERLSAALEAACPS